MRRIHSRGHEIGLHPSYGTFRDAAQTKREFERLLNAAEQEGVKQDSWGGRQHYLRWEAPATWQNWEEAGLNYDSTLSYADRTGFRCGSCYEYPTFNVRERRRLNLVERPLIVMEASLLEKQYMNLTLPAAQKKIFALAQICKSFGGQFTLLWHNSGLLSSREKRIYRETIEGLV
jgi:peptidoglycan/xylan/chitin deacetylase (PgdA/CDA1 family)